MLHTVDVLQEDLRAVRMQNEKLSDAVQAASARCEKIQADCMAQVRATAERCEKIQADCTMQIAAAGQAATTGITTVVDRFSAMMERKDKTEMSLIAQMGMAALNVKMKTQEDK